MAIEETDRKYGAYCFQISNNILNCREDSEECVNDTWLKTWDSIPPTKPQCFRFFLARIVRNLSFNKYTKVKNRKSLTILTHRMPFSNQKNEKYVLRHKYFSKCLLY